MHWRACILKVKPRTETVPRREPGKSATCPLASTVSSRIGMHGVIGERMVRSWSGMNQGSRTGEERRSWLLGEPEELYPGGDRAFVVARKRSNARGAKGGRKVEPLNQRRREANTVNVLWTQCGDEHQRCKPSAAARWLLAASETRVNHGSSLNDPWLRRTVASTGESAFAF